MVVLASVLQRAELAAAGGEAGDRRRLPVDRRVGDDRLVAEHDLDLAVARGGDRDLPVLAELVEQLVAAVEQVVGALPGLDGGADRLVELREAGGGRLDRARGAGEVGVLGGGVGAGAAGAAPARLPNASASAWAAALTACLALSDSGWLARSVQAVQNLPSSALMPVVAGSPMALCTLSSASALVVASPSAMFCARNWRSRN